MTLYDEIVASGLPLNDHGAIAEYLSRGRKKLVPTEIGHGVILETLGIEDGNALLDIIYSMSEFRHVKPLLERGVLRIDSPLVRSVVDTICSPENASKLKSLAEVDDVITSQEVTKALEGK